jgi:hypothetical protein
MEQAYGSRSVGAVETRVRSAGTNILQLASKIADYANV